MTSIPALQQIASKFLAQALTEVFPGCLLIEGAYSNVLFHYDAILPQKIDDSMICLIEEKMRGLIKSLPPIRVMDMMRQNAAEYFRYHDQPLIAAQIDEMEDILVSVLELGSFKDLCAPEDIPSESELFPFEILAMDHQLIDDQWVTHVTGSAQFQKEDLKSFVKRFRQAKKVDHRKLGPELGLFAPLSPEQWAWLPHGEQLKSTLMQLNLNSIRVTTPLDLDPELLHINPKRAFDPTAAWHLWLYKNSQEPALRLTEFTQKLDAAKPSQLNGMLRNRLYTADITHIFCSAAQVQKELIYSLQFLAKIIKIFGFEVQWVMRTKRPHSTVNASEWDLGVKAFTTAVQTLGLPAVFLEAPGSTKGPKLEALFSDALGQQWCGSFVQIDCCHPRLMKPAGNEKAHQTHTPNMIALSVWGSLERMAALLVENHQGLPQWPAFLKEVHKKINSINEESVSSIES